MPYISTVKPRLYTTTCTCHITCKRSIIEKLRSKGVAIHAYGVSVWRFRILHLYRCHMKMGTPGPHLHNILGTPGSPISRDFRDPPMKMGTPTHVYMYID